MFDPLNATLLEYTNNISDTLRGGGEMGDVEVFGPIQGSFLCRLSKELALNASHGTEVIHNYFTFTCRFRAVGNIECRLHISPKTRSVYSQVTVAAVTAGDVLTSRPGGEHLTTFTVTGEDSYFLMQTGEKGEIQINTSQYNPDFDINHF